MAKQKNLLTNKWEPEKLQKPVPTKDELIKFIEHKRKKQREATRRWRAKNVRKKK